MPLPPPLKPGRTLGAFTLEGKLGGGGMAEIWTARGPSGRLALKVLRAELSIDPDFVAMFRDEVRIGGHLRHPNIVEVDAVHEADGVLFQSMELLEGHDLRQVLVQQSRLGRRLPVSVCLFIARELSRALAYAHQRKADDGRPLDIVHRDVSPHNIMLGTDGRVKLLDFGVARSTDRAVRTKTGMLKGKLAYMAPEQALAETVTARTDIFAAGIVLWEMLTVQRLFVGDNHAQILNRVVEAKVPDVTRHNPDVPEDVARLVRRMLERDPEHRPASMEAVERTLDRMLATYGTDANEAELERWMKAHGPAVEPVPRDRPPSVFEVEPEVEPTLQFGVDDEVSGTFVPGPSDETLEEDDAEHEDVTLSTPFRPAPTMPVTVQPTPHDAGADAADAPTPRHATPDFTPSEEPTPSLRPPPSNGSGDVSGPTGGLVAPELPTPAGDIPDVAATWVDQRAPDFSAPPAEVSTAPGGDTDEIPGRGAPAKLDKVRAPTRSEIMRAVEQQATVEVQADEEVAELARQLLQKEATPQVSTPKMGATQPIDLGQRPSEQSTLRGDLVPVDIPIGDSDGFEPIGAKPAPPQRSARDPSERPAPPAPARKNPWAWVLPAITLTLAVVVVVLIFLLIQGQ